MRVALIASVRSQVPVALLALLASACGGSSSETPPPLQPDPTSARYNGPRIPSALDEVATPAPTPAEPEPEPEPDAPRRPAPATWGSGKSTPALEPRMSSPTALPAGAPTSSVAVPPKK